jgi:uncharacterized YigZ family protein
MENKLRYRTIDRPATGEFRDRGSKFFSFAYPVNSAEEVKERVQYLKKEHPKAVHHCFAFRIGTDGTQYRANDDGEPSGSAGKPMLGQIDSAELTNVLVVVVRYFGGSLLGVPGLINAYKTATQEALQNAAITERWIEDLVELEFEYPNMSEVMYLLRQSEATVYHQDLQLFCIVKAGIPRKHSPTYVERLSEIRNVRVKRV